MAFELPDLPYSHDALAGKGMSAETLEYHHDLHHKGQDDGHELAARMFLRRFQQPLRDPSEIVFLEPQLG